MPSVFKYNGNEIIDSNGNITASSVKNALNASGDAPVYACRAWVNFDGTDTSSANPLSFTNTNATNHGDSNSAGETLCAIRGSGNVSKVVRNGTGDYTITFTTNMPNANYCIAGSSGGQGSTSNGAVYQYDQATAKSQSLVRVLTANSSGNSVDTPQIAFAVFC